MSQPQQDPQVQKDTLASGARHVDETEHLASGLEESPMAPTLQEREFRDGVTHDEVRTVPGKLVLTMLQNGSRVQVRVGSPYEPSNTFEGLFDSPEDAHTALRDAGVLTAEQSPDSSQLPTGLELENVSTSQLGEAGLQHRRSTSSL